MVNKGWMTKEKVRARIEKCIDGRLGTYIDDRDMVRIVREVQYLVKDGYARSYILTKGVRKRGSA
jgi:hypothetical protein